MTVRCVELEGECKVREVYYSTNSDEGGWVELETYGMRGSEIIELSLCVWNSKDVLDMFNEFGKRRDLTPRVRVSIEWEE